MNKDEVTKPLNKEECDLEGNASNSHCTTAASGLTLEDMFSDRYSMANESFARICEGFDPVICMYPFHSRQKRNYERGYQYRGGSNHGRGGWRGGRGRGGDHWRNNDRRGQRRSWDDRSNYDSSRGDRKIRRE
ncbi:hypothetical protein NECAME_14769 [Necator americanus]|nr:hypothetical protein NECAME_14769 [Necator americanus]ETN70428.1 hypothetical protein NECAME_14769 [Necator americanus]